MHPRCHSSSHDLLKRSAESAVAAVAALGSELLGCESASLGYRLLVQADKVADAKSVDIGVVGDTLLGKVLAQISPVCADGACQLRQPGKLAPAS